MKTIILVLALVAFTTALHKPNKPLRNILQKRRPLSNSRIVNGQRTEPHEITYQAFLEFYILREGWYCGGTLISQNYVLTSAHCADGATTAYVTLGAYRIFADETTQIRLTSKNFTIHPDWNKELFLNDIALVQLPTSVDFNDEISAVLLPSLQQGLDDLTSRIARVTGWGITDGYSALISQYLLYADAEIIAIEECRKTFSDLNSNMICTSGKENSPCDADTGGPLTIDGIQVGIVSFGVLSCPDGYPFVFTKITSFLDWIATNSDVIIH